MKIECNTCGGQISTPDDSIVGELVGCKDCGVEYEIVSINGNQIQLQAAESIKEDWGE
ncbi:MAG: lysine biosynthesis protein LysW [Thermoplasmatales archaeon B_DKE]|nr:MAG: lysine biosynthesis protein LysW [Thermoplasmatales archaeon B_DKE]